MNPRAAMQSSSAIQCEISSGRVVYTRDSGRVSCTNHTPRWLRFPRVACECMETHTSTRLQIGLRQREGWDEGFFSLFSFSVDCFGNSQVHLFTHIIAYRARLRPAYRRECHRRQPSLMGFTRIYLKPPQEEKLRLPKRSNSPFYR